MFTLMGAMVIVADASPRKDCLIASWAGCPAWLTASALLAVNCHSVDGPARCAPVTLKIHLLLRLGCIHHRDDQVFAIGTECGVHVERIGRAAGALFRLIGTAGGKLRRRLGRIARERDRNRADEVIAIHLVDQSKPIQGRGGLVEVDQVRRRWSARPS